MGDLQSRGCFSKMSKSHASVTTLLSSHSQCQGPKRPDLKGMSFVFFLWPTGERQDQVKGFSKDVDEKHGCGCVWKWLNGFSFKMTIYIFNVVGKMMINHQTLGFSIFKAMQCHASAWNHQYPWPFSHRLGNSNIPKLKGTIWKSGHLPWPRKITNIFFSANHR